MEISNKLYTRDERRGTQQQPQVRVPLATARGLGQYEHNFDTATPRIDISRMLVLVTRMLVLVTMRVSLAARSCPRFAPGGCHDIRRRRHAVFLGPRQLLSHREAATSPPARLSRPAAARMIHARIRLGPILIVGYSHDHGSAHSGREKADERCGYE